MDCIDLGIILHSDGDSYQHPRYRDVFETVEGVYRVGGVGAVIQYLAGSGKFTQPPPLPPNSGTVESRQQAYLENGIDGLFANMFGMD